MYKNGKGIEKNLEKTFYWYQKAAENGQSSAKYNLGWLYQNGFGTEKNLEKAFYWYQKAAENGEGIEKNLEKAFYWYQKASENENKKEFIKKF